MLDDAVARQDTITMLATQIRRVRKLIPELVSVWVRDHNLVPGRPPCDWDDPADRDRLVSELVDDANEVVWAAEDLVEGGLEFSRKQADAVALLALVAGQDVEPGDGRATTPNPDRHTPSVPGANQRNDHTVYRPATKTHLLSSLLVWTSVGHGGRRDMDTSEGSFQFLFQPSSLNR